MILFIQNIIDAIKELLPSREDNERTYAFKLTVLLIMALIIGGALLTVALTTTWGKKIGIERIQQKQEVLSHTELALHMRQIFHLLTRVKSNDPNVRALYLVLLVDKKTGSVVLKDMDVNETSALVWIWNLPANQINSIDIMEHGINLAKIDIEPRLRQERGCIDGNIEQKILGVFKRSIVDFQSNRYAMCPIYSRGGNFLIASTIMFYVDKDTKVDSVGNVIPSQTEETRQVALKYKDALWETTNLVGNYFYDYKIPYVFYYN